MSQTTPLSQLEDAQKGFNLLFSDDITGAKEALRAGTSPFHITGLGIVCFIQAILGLEEELMPEAAELLSKAEQSSKAALKAAKAQATGTPKGAFPPGLEWEILQADAVVFNGLVNALNESYVGMVKALYALYNANSRFNKLFKAVFPAGIPSTGDSTTSSAMETPIPKPAALGIVGRLGSSFSRPSSRPSTPSSPLPTNGMIDSFILAGAAFGFGLFTLAMSLLPPRVRSLIGWFGLQSDRQLALQALTFAASKEGVHSVFASIALLGYWDFVSSLSGWQADETGMLSRFETVLEPLEKQYSEGALWILYKAKLRIMHRQVDEGMQILRTAVEAERPSSFKQTGALLIFELAWTSFGQREYAQAGDLFVQMTQENNWSHATYRYIAACCHLAAGNPTRAEEVFTEVRELLKETLKNGKELPAEAFIRKRLAYYGSKQVNKASPGPSKVSESMVINGAEEIAIFWNVHSRTTISAAEARIKEWMALTPLVVCPESPFATGIEESSATNSVIGDELTLRDLLLGIVHRTAKHFAASRTLLERVLTKEGKLKLEHGTGWMIPTAAFEIAVLELHEANAKNASESLSKEAWRSILKSASAWLAKAIALSSNSHNMSTRLEIRIATLQDEISQKTASLERS